MTAPLDGVRVLDLTRVLAGPLSTMLLGDLGADVIKIERRGTGDDTRGWGPPFHDDESAYFLGVNRNKRSVTLDVGQPAGIDLLGRLLAHADVVVDNFKVGTLPRWGFDDAWFSENAPRAVRCSITGYGSTGPKAGLAGYDFILQAESGLMSITGTADGEPMKVGVAIVDICTGLLAAISVLGGLRERDATGRGGSYEVNLHDTSLMMLANVAANYLVSDAPPRRYGNGHPNIVPYRSYTTADGELAVSVGNDAQFAVLAEVLGHADWSDEPRFATNAARVAHREEIDGLIGALLRRRPRHHWVELFARAGIPAGPINTVPEALSSPQTVGRGLIDEVAQAGGEPFRLLGSPLRWGADPVPVRRPPPRLGEHTDDVLHELLGLGGGEIAELRRAGIL